MFFTREEAIASYEHEVNSYLAIYEQNLTYFNDNISVDDLSVDEIQDYYLAYLHNVKQLASRVVIEWIEPEEFLEYYTSDTSTTDGLYKDPFIDTPEALSKLGRDIMENGTYWVITAHEASPNFYIIGEGVHRARAIQQLIRDGEWTRRILVVKDKLHDYSDLEMLVPRNVPLVYRDYSHYYVYGACRYVDRLNDDYYKLNVIDVNGFLNVLSIIPLLIRDSIFKHRDEVTPSKVLNDEDAWNAFIGGKNGNS